MTRIIEKETSSYVMEPNMIVLPTNTAILIPSGALCLKWQPSHKNLYGTPAETWGLKLKAAGFLGWMGGGGGGWP